MSAKGKARGLDRALPDRRFRRRAARGTKGGREPLEKSSLPLTAL
ncbi:hypothetical protein DWUX_2709 [Desulfovibrio diazotrophicus]|nr:hypothetical protein DWUX_2709 [Desulfovibrio diazotrophicus]